MAIKVFYNEWEESCLIIIKSKFSSMNIVKVVAEDVKWLKKSMKMFKATLVKGQFSLPSNM